MAAEGGFMETMQVNLSSVGASLDKLPKSNGTMWDFLKEFPTTIWASSHGKVLLTIWGSAPFLALFMYFRKRQARQRWAELDKKRAAEEALLAEKKELAPEPPKPKQPPFWTRLKGILKIIFPSMLNKSGIFIIIYTAVLCSRVYITIKLANMVGSLGSLMAKREFKTMFLLQAWFGLLCYPASLSNALMKFFEKKIALQFRVELTSYLLKKYLSRATFYKLKMSNQLDNLDQRLTDDVEKFCSTLTYVYGHIIKPTLDTLFLTNALGQLMGYKQIFLFYIYFFGANQILSAIKPNFSRLVSEKQRLEGFYRSEHTRIVQYSEEIAFVEGAGREHELAMSSFNKLEKHTDQDLWTHFWMELIDGYVMKYGGTMCAYSAIIPSVYINWKGMSTQQATQHYLTATNMLLSLGASLKDIILSYKEVAKLEGLTNRVGELVDKVNLISSQEAALEAKSKQGGAIKVNPEQEGVLLRSSETDSVRLEECDIYTPDGQTKLVDKLSLDIKPGEHLLIMGMNGTGKSSMFRTMGELWPLNKGTMKLPPKSDLYFVSQNSYMPPGTLRDQLTYPEHVEKPTAELDAQLKQYLEMVNLGNLLNTFTFDSVANWRNLSGGEKQRVVIARLYYHRPKFGILDECTSAVSVEVVDQIFEQAQKLGITIITIAHTTDLKKHHKCQLTLLGAGQWKLEAI